MIHFKNFSYSDASRRWMILSAMFLSFFSLTVLISDMIITFHQFLPYYPIIRVIVFLSLVSFLAGNISGKAIYSYVKKFRFINVFISTLIFLFIIGYFLKDFVFGNPLSNFNLYLKSRYLTLLIIAVPAFLTGIINSYFIKVSTGDFIDEKNLTGKYFGSFFTALSLGIIVVLSAHMRFSGQIYFRFIYILLYGPVIPLMFLIKFPFITENLVAQHYLDDDHYEEDTEVQRDDLFYAYINFSLITIYIVLGLIAFNRYIGSNYYYNLLFISTVIFSVFIGSNFGRIKRIASFHIYSEMLFPLFFLLFIFLLYYYEGKVNAAVAYLFAVLPSLLFGISIKQTVLNISRNYKHEKRFKILNFSFFILPVPIVIAASLINYTNLFFFVVLYSVTALNIIIPAIFLFNSDLNWSRKLFYFVISLLFVPAVVFIHMYFKIPLNNSPYVNNISNFELLKNTNFNLKYITEKGEIKYQDSVIFYLSDSTIRNFKRAAAATLLFGKDDSRVMVIDSNQKFFRNPVFGFYNNAVVVDNVPSSFISYNRLPVSGSEKYITVQREILHQLIDNSETYNKIIDFPNILDQNFHPFRFSKEYYELVKKRVAAGGLYITAYDLHFANYKLVSDSLSNIAGMYQNNLVFIFSDIVLVVSSDSMESLLINGESVRRMDKFLETFKNDLIFYDRTQPLNNLIFNNLDSLKQFLATEAGINPYFYGRIDQKELPENLAGYYLDFKNDWINSVFLKEKDDYNEVSKFRNRFYDDRKIFTILKEAEYAEATNSYKMETDLLFQLKKYIPYNDRLRNYLLPVLEYKEKYYYSEALRLEKEKKWDDAAVLYEAILTMNSKNFDANYRFGLLFITLQDLTSAFKYLDIALKLNKDHPQVLYQMGILQFSSDKYKEAIEYLEKSRGLGIDTATLYFYLGISYEKLNKDDKAIENLEKAVILDPGDAKLRSLLDQLNNKINKSNNPGGTTEEKRNMSDDEKDEEIKIPVIKRAIRARLGDDEE